MNYGYIYKTTNIINNMFYIGQKKGKFNPNYFGSGKYFKNAINKYKKNNFKIEIICYIDDKEEADIMECYYIKEGRNKFGKNMMYNITEGGGGTQGYKHTQVTIEKIRLAVNSPDFMKKNRLAKELSQETIEKMRLAKLGKKFSLETIKKMRKPKSIEHCKNIGLAKLGNKYSYGIKRSEETKNKLSKAAHNQWKNKREKMLEALNRRKFKGEYK